MRTLNNRRAPLARAAFTLVELCIAAATLVIILGGVGMVVMSAGGVYEQGMSKATLESQARRTLQRLANELTSAGSATLQPPPVLPLGGSSVSYRTSAGFWGGALQWSPVSRIDLRPDPRDAADGIDNDGDGSVDEQQIVLVLRSGQPDETEAVICTGVSDRLEGETANLADDNGNGLTDERGLSILTDGNGTLTVRLTLVARSPTGGLVLSTVETSVHMRN